MFQDKPHAPTRTTHARLHPPPTPNRLPRAPRRTKTRRPLQRHPRPRKSTPRRLRSRRPQLAHDHGLLTHLQTRRLEGRRKTPKPPPAREHLKGPETLIAKPPRARLDS